MIGNFILCVSLLINMRVDFNNQINSIAARQPLNKNLALSSLKPLAFSNFQEDFETGAVGWETKDLTPMGYPTWHPDTFNTYGSSGLSWWSGDPTLKGYSNASYVVLSSPAVTLPSAACTLTFKMNYAVENPAGAQSPYDGWDGCNVRISTDGGATWTVLTNPVPAYNCASLYSFGSQHWEGVNVPGWGGSSSGWIDVSLDLSSYQGQTVKIRWAMASDPAYCTADDATLIGMQIDNINIAGVLTNDGTDTTGWASETMVLPAGDHWALTDSSYHSASHAYHCPNGKKYLNALASPMITLPDTTPIVLTYWVYCNMPDWNGDADNYLDDYYFVLASTDSTISYDNTDSIVGGDYAYRGADTAWTMRDSLLISGNPVAARLDALKGQTIRLEFVLTTDNDDNGGVGSGLFIDDINIVAPGVEEENGSKITKYSLTQSLPNPFHKNTTVKYSIPCETHTKVTIYTISGQEIMTLVDSKQIPGAYTVNWNGRDKNGQEVPTGIYLYKLTTDNFSATKKMVLVR